MVVVALSSTTTTTISRTKRKSFCWGLKIHTVITVTIGLSMLVLFSLEPRILFFDPTRDDYYKDLSNRNLQYQHQYHHQYQYQSSDTTTSANYPPPHPPHPPHPPTLQHNHQRQQQQQYHGSITPRYGMVQRQALRTNILHPIDPMTQQYQTETDRESMNQTPVRSHPRVFSFALDGGSMDSTALPNSITTTESYRQVEPMSLQPGTDHTSHVDESSAILPFERSFWEECEPRIDPPAPQVHPTCNSLHETTPLKYDAPIDLLSSKGSWRSAWTVHNDTAVLKVLHWHRAFDEEAYRQHALDVWVSDVLTASPYVIDAYGFCGQSILQEWAPSGGRELIKSYDIRNRQRLKIARDLARGLADLQALQVVPHEHQIAAVAAKAIQNPGSPLTSPPIAPPMVFSHNDINIANTLQIDGRVKWNDFNIGVLLRDRIGNNGTEDCGAPVKFRADLWRSPEEIQNTSYVQLEYTDMYGFGNILYQVMTRHQPWTHKEPEGQLTVEQVADRKRIGGLPTIPGQYKNTTNKDLQTMMFATLACYHPVPTKRLTAYELAHALGIVYNRLQHKQKVTFSMLRNLFLSK